MSHRPITFMLLFFILSPFLITVATNLGWGVNGVLFAFMLAAIAVLFVSHMARKLRQAFSITWIQENADEGDILEDCTPISSRWRDPFLQGDMGMYSVPPRDTSPPYFQGYQNQRVRGDLAERNDQAVSSSEDYDQPKASYPESMPPPLQ